MLHQMCCVKYWKVSYCIILQFWRTLQWTSLKPPGNTSFEWSPWDVPRTSILYLFYKCIFIAFLFHQVCAWNTKMLAALKFCVFGETFQRCPINVPKGCPEHNVLETLTGCQFWTCVQKCIFVVIFSVLIHQMCLLDTNKVAIAYIFSFRKTS